MYKRQLINKPLRTDSLYGPAITQAAMSRVDLLHDAGFKGQGMTIAVIDACFHNVDKIDACLLYTSDEDGVSEEVKQKEIEVAIEKTKAEQVQKAVEAALKKDNINPAHVASEEHMDSNMAKGWITAEDVAKAKEIIATAVSYTHL